MIKSGDTSVIRGSLTPTLFDYLTLANVAKMSCKDVTGMTFHIDNKVSSQMLFRCFLSLSLDNHTMETHSAVSIRILDVNDNPPELALPYEASICEDAKPGQVSTFISENETHKSCS